MKIIRLAFAFLLLISLTDCNNASKKPVADGTTATPAPTFGEFESHFSPVQLPLFLPPQDNSGPAKEIDPKLIEAFLKDKSTVFAFGPERDVPEIAENPAAGKYYAEGMLPDTKNYSGFIVRKKGTGDYYYLVTFNLKGEYLSGICLAFQESDQSGKTERSASLNDDYSLQIRQTDGSSHSAFFEITPDGMINPIKKGV